jgi:hypothetical protein
MGYFKWEPGGKSKIKDSGPMLPARIVREFRESDRNYRSSLGTFPESGEPWYSYGRFLNSEEAALERFHKRTKRP